MRRRRFVAATCGWILAAPVMAAPAPRLRIGLTAVILADFAAFLSRWSQYLSPRLGCEVAFAARDSYQAIEDMLASGHVDAAWVCGYPYVQHEAQWRLLAIPLYHGHPRYQSYLIRPKTVGEPTIRGWTDLRGKVFAYSDPLSNSGWLVAQEQLARAGIGPHDLRRTFYAHGHRNVAEAVAAQLADAGSIDGYIWETMRAQRMSAALETEVVWKSPWHGFPPIVAPQSAMNPVIEALQRVLLAMPQDAEGRALLQALNLTGFMAGDPSVFDSIRKLARDYGTLK